ncbi:hypothetical protein DV738_g4292, partial [Chaetothyriales sp. CBS 135597]
METATWQTVLEYRPSETKSHMVVQSCSYQFRRPARPPTQRIRDLEEHLRYAQNFIKTLQTKASEIDDVDFESVLGVLDFSLPASLSSPSSPIENESKTKLASMMTGHNHMVHTGPWSCSFFGPSSGFALVMRTLELFQKDIDQVEQNARMVANLFDSPVPDAVEHASLPSQDLALRLVTSVFARCPFIHFLHEDNLKEEIKKAYRTPSHDDFPPLFHMVFALGYVYEHALHQEIGCHKAAAEATKHYLSGRRRIDLCCSVFSQSDVDIRQLANVERDLRNWANDAARLFDGLGPKLKHELSSTYLHVQITLYMPFLHYLRVMAAGAAISLNQSQHALACLKVASTTILKTEAAMNSGAFCPTSWRSVYSVFLAVICLVFLIAAHNGTSQPSEAWKRALAGIRILAACRCCDNGADACLAILKMVVRRLKHTVDFDIEQVEASTPRLCQGKIVDSFMTMRRPMDEVATPGSTALFLSHILHQEEMHSDADKILKRAEAIDLDKDLEAFTSSYQALLQRVQALDGQVQDLTADLQNETNSRRLWQNRAEDVEYRVSKNQYVLVLVDGNQTWFRDSVIHSASSKADEVANHLVAEAREVARRQHSNDLSDDFSVLVHIFVDTEKLCQDLIAAGSISSAQQLKEFLNDLMSAQSLITVINCGSTVTDRVKASYELNIENCHCRHIILALGPHSEYYETLDMYSEDDFTKLKTSLVQPENGFPSQYSLPFHTATFSMLDTVRLIPFGEIESETNGTYKLQSNRAIFAAAILSKRALTSCYIEPKLHYGQVTILPELKPDGGA